MTEALYEKTEYEGIAPDIMTTIIRNLETSVVNARVLQEVLDEEHRIRRNVTVESLSSSFDLGGFFVDEVNSSENPSYRMYMRVGKNGGDAITGNVLGLVGRKIDGKPTLQIEMDVGYEEGPTRCYFNLDKTLEGCEITRVGIEAEQTS